MVEQELPTCPWCKRYTTRHMDAYYYGFEPTGIDVIDNILCSVASAGKAYHHTESWGESIDRTDGGESYVSRIQGAANVAAEEMRRSTPPPAVDVEAVVSRLSVDVAMWDAINEFAAACRDNESTTSVRRQHAVVAIMDGIRRALSRATGGMCDHRFESNPGMYDTSHRYCAKCGRAE